MTFNALVPSIAQAAHQRRLGRLGQKVLRSRISVFSSSPSVTKYCRHLRDRRLEYFLYGVSCYHEDCRLLAPVYHPTEGAPLGCACRLESMVSPGREGSSDERHPTQWDATASASGCFSMILSLDFHLQVIFLHQTLQIVIPLLLKSRTSFPATADVHADGSGHSGQVM